MNEAQIWEKRIAAFRQFSWTHVSLSMFKFHPQIIWNLKAELDMESWAISVIAKAEGI